MIAQTLTNPPTHLPPARPGKLKLCPVNGRSKASFRSARGPSRPNRHPPECCGEDHFMMRVPDGRIFLRCIETRLGRRLMTGATNTMTRRTPPPLEAAFLCLFAGRPPDTVPVRGEEGGHDLVRVCSAWRQGRPLARPTKPRLGTHHDCNHARSSGRLRPGQACRRLTPDAGGFRARFSGPHMRSTGYAHSPRPGSRRRRCTAFQNHLQAIWNQSPAAPCRRSSRPAI